MEQIKKFLFQNTGAKQTIVKNTVWLFLGEFGGRVLKLALVVFATRTLGVTDWGVFSYALSFVTLFYVFGDIGINTFTIREMARGGADKYQYLSASFFLKIALLILSFTASILLMPHFGKMPLSVHIVIVLAILAFSDAVREFALSINRALEKMEREAYIKVFMNVIITILGILLLLGHATPLSLAIAYAAGSVAATVAALLIVFPQLKHINWRFSPNTVRIIFNFSWPFIAIYLFSTVIFSIDSIMLGQIKSATEVGLYSAALRVVQFLSIIPIFIGMSVFPIMAKREAEADMSSRIFEKSMAIVLAIGFPIAVGGFMFREQIISLIFGPAYAQAGILLGILMLTVLANFSNILLSNAIFAKNLQRKFIIATTVGVVVTILLNLFLIPKYGAPGAAISTATAQLLIMGINWQKLKKVFNFSIVPQLAKAVIASIVVALVILLCNLIKIYFLLTILISVVTYVVTLVLMREELFADLKSVLKF